MNFKTELVNYFKAGIPAVQVVTFEEQRILNEIVNAYEDRGVAIWKVTKGWHTNGDGNMEDKTENIMSPFINFLTRPEKILVIFDFDELGEERPEFKRKVRDALPVLENGEKKMIFINKKPIEMQEIFRLEYELPDRESINKILEGIIESVNEAGADIKPSKKEKLNAVQSAQGLTENELKNAFSLALVKTKKLNGEATKIIQKFKVDTLASGGTLEFFEPDVAFADIGGNAELKQYIQKRALLFSDDAKKAGVPTPKGIIICGITGTGKSLSAKMIGSLYNLPLIRLNVGSLFGGLVGQSEENLRMTMKKIEAISPCILWIDEIDKAFAGIKSGNTGSDVPQRLFGELLTFFTESKKQIFKIATCNNMAVLPPEITNRTRFDDCFFIDLPTENERREIFKIHLAKNNIELKSYDKAVKASNGYTPSEIENIIKEAIINSYYEKKDVDEAELLAAIKSSKPISITMKSDIDAMRADAKDRYRFANGTEEPVKIEGGRKIDLSEGKKGTNPSRTKPLDN